MSVEGGEMFVVSFLRSHEKHYVMKAFPYDVKDYKELNGVLIAGSTIAIADTYAEAVNIIRNLE